MLKSSLIPVVLTILIGCMLWAKNPLIANLATGLSIVFSLLIIRFKSQPKS
ncbi:MAG: hypothetical protein N2044_02000 [Cyclobacteriaceae bacterium]|nr:hypothetical protein [Cyclobacteriaceae bacterium]MCX7636597.1 hypothetical protein [Cyclobacteriaceae bacterium]MDW8330611.1 hypothetical protein [Cyclobacteriaceae bacterium]